MLVELAVRDLGVIADLRLLVGPGMTALTGETGAGKTMIVEALALLLGGKADPGRVRPRAEEAVVEGRFVDGEREVVLRRVVPRSGRSRSYVDGNLATAAELSTQGAALVDLHGQHSQQSLMSARVQRDALDRYGSIDLSRLTEARAEVRRLRAALDALGGDDRSRARELDLVRFQVDELVAAELVDPLEDDVLAAEHDVQADAAEHRRAGREAHELIAADGAAADLVARAVAEIEGRRPYADLEVRLRSVAAELDDVRDALRSAADSIDDDPDRLAEIRVRRQRLVELRRKYGDTLADVIAERDALVARLEELESHDARAEALDAELAVALEAEAGEAAAVGAARRRAAPRLAKDIGARLAQVALPGVVVEVTVGADDPGDDVEFLISANAGMEPRPLRAVASGGELSRTMLALHLVLSAGPPVMVFDEVDAGIGGATAVEVGRALAGLADRHQVLVVTHLPQVAAFADQQVQVAKTARRGVTATAVVDLSDAERVVELSRMLSGTPESDAARRHAEELLASAASERGR